MKRLFALSFMLNFLCAPTPAAVTSRPPNSYASVMLSNSGDTSASAAVLIGYSFAGDVIGPADDGRIAIGTGFWYGDADKSRGAFPSTIQPFDTLMAIITDWNRNRNGNIADTIVVTVTNTRTIEICWDKSPSSDMTGGGQYNVYWDNGTGVISETATLAIIPHTSDTHYCITTGTLTIGTLYSFMIRAQDRFGNENRDSTKVSAFAMSIQPIVPHAVIVHPQAGKRLIEEVIVVAEIYPETAITVVGAVLFQYRTDTTNAAAPWTNMAKRADQQPNPDSRPQGNRFKTSWDIQGIVPGNPALLTGSYQIRAVAIDSAGRQDTAAAIMTVDIVNNNPDRRDRRENDKSQTTSEVIHRGGENEIFLADDSTIARVILPEGVLNSETTSMNVTMTPVALVLQGPLGKKIVSSAMKVSLANNQTQFATPVTIEISYQDNDTDGLVDGTSIKVKDLEIYNFSAGVWETAANMTVDTQRKRAHGTTTHFSTFLLVGPGPATSLAGLRVAPNPFRPNDNDPATGVEFNGAAGSGIYFMNTPASVRIEIYTIAGSRVADFTTSASSGQVQWDVRNGDGKLVESGFYVYIVTDIATNQRRTGKLAIAR